MRKLMNSKEFDDQKEINRWELIVYPSLFAFVILAAYGFYLIYNLARDVHFLAVSVDTNMTILAGDMQTMAANMGEMTANVRTMAVTMDSIDDTVLTLKPMLANLNNMDQSMQTLNQDIRQISATAYYMGHNMGRMSQGVNKISNPVRMFMPW
jgi:uncharacterized protein YoxC